MAAPARSLALVRQEDEIRLEMPARAGEAWFLLHRTSQERTQLPAPRMGGWLIDYDEATGQAYLDDSDDPEQPSRWAIDLQKLALYRDEEGVRFLRGKQGKVMSLHEWASEKFDLQAHWVAGKGSDEEHICRAAMFRMTEGCY